MEVTKEQIASGVSTFIQKDVAPEVGDTATQIILEIAASAIASNPKLLDPYLENPMFGFVAKVGNAYNLKVLKQSAMAAMDKYGKLTITIPGIKFISPDEKILQFGSEDVKMLVDRIEGR
jgi:hypothetical protein